MDKAIESLGAYLAPMLQVVVMLFGQYKNQLRSGFLWMEVQV